MLKTLVIESQTKYCFIETNDEIIPIKDCVEIGENICGFDFYNNIQVSVNKQCIHSVYHLERKNLMFENYQTLFNNISDHLTVHNIKIEDCRDFLYKKIPTSQKIVSILLKKDINDITLDELKQFWKTHINEYCANFIVYIDTELNEISNDEYKKEMLSIKTQLKDIQAYKELDKIETKEALLKYWPVLLMPAPSFVEV